MKEREYAVVTNKTLLMGMSKMAGELRQGDDTGISKQFRKDIILKISSALDSIFELINNDLKVEE